MTTLNLTYPVMRFLSHVPDAGLIAKPDFQTSSLPFVMAAATMLSLYARVKLDMLICSPVFYHYAKAAPFSVYNLYQKH